MTTKQIYGPWIKWHGGNCPVPPATNMSTPDLLAQANELLGRMAVVFANFNAEAA